jgi:tRNA(fMet)-specific endonuclease VapC
VKFLLDTTVISDFARGIQPVLDRLKSTSKDNAGISVVTMMEIEYGLKLNPARARKIEPIIRALLHDLQELPFEREDANAAAAIRAALGKRGTPIGPYDVMIGGTALRRGLTLVTSNGDEFERIGGLVVEDWRERTG